MRFHPDDWQVPVCKFLRGVLQNHAPFKAILIPRAEPIAPPVAHSPAPWCCRVAAWLRELAARGVQGRRCPQCPPIVGSTSGPISDWVAIAGERQLRL